MSAITAMKTRQKSCIPCANAKRKCDQEEPACLRCISRGVSCTYKPGKPSRKSDVQHESFLSRFEASPVTLDSTEDWNQTPQLSANATFAPSTAADSLNLEPLPLTFDTPGNFPSASYNNQDITLDEMFFQAYDTYLLAPTYPEIGTMDKDRIKFCVSKLKSYPAMLAHTARTPFLHPNSYVKLPTSLQEACSAAALYVVKNESNDDMVWEIIEEKANSLVQSPEVEWWGLSDHLAAVQALVIFQIIRLFDGDIAQRARAEAHESVLSQWTERLARRTGIRENSSETLIMHSSYHSWLFGECVARTVLISLVLEAMFSIQKKGYCTLVDRVTEMSFAAQRDLWEAKSEQHWMKARTEKDAFFVEKMDFGGVLERAEFTEIDDLGLLMLVTYKGVDGVNDWILKSGNVPLLE